MNQANLQRILSRVADALEGLSPAPPMSADLEAAVEWSMTRGAGSGRVAWQFIQDLAGRLGATLD